MVQIANIVLPVFGLIAVGYAVAWGQLIHRETGEAMAEFVFCIAIPFFIFRIIVTADFGDTTPWRLWLVFYGSYALVWMLGHFIFRQVFGRDHPASMVGGMSSAFGNTALVGLPLVMTAYGDAAAVPIALILAVHMPVCMTMGTILIHDAQRRSGVSAAPFELREVAVTVIRNLFINPVVIGILAGLVWRATVLPLNGLHGNLVSRIADIAPTMALVALGMGLRKYGIRRNISAGLAISVLKLLILPLVVLLLARYVILLSPLWAKVAVLTAASPTGINAYLIANRFHAGEALSSNAIAFSTGLAVASVSFWLFVVAQF